MLSTLGTGAPLRSLLLLHDLGHHQSVKQKKISGFGKKSSRSHFLCGDTVITKASNSSSPSPGNSKEDIDYVLKLGAGCVAGAAAIKYGSILFPELTTPNLPQALTMIFAPVVVAVILLLTKSRAP